MTQKRLAVYKMGNGLRLTVHAGERYLWNKWLAKFGGRPKYECRWETRNSPTEQWRNMIDHST